MGSVNYQLRRTAAYVADARTSEAAGADSRLGWVLAVRCLMRGLSDRPALVEGPPCTKCGVPWSRVHRCATSSG